MELEERTIILRCVSGLWMAWFEKDPGVQGTGRTKAEAIGDLVLATERFQTIVI